jgi:hypothetical protein
VNLCRTAPASSRLRQRPATALKLRLRGLSYKQIADTLKCHPSTAHSYICATLQNFVPKETAEAVLQLELVRLDELQGAIYLQALAGDLGAVKASLKIQDQRQKLLGLRPTNNQPSLHFNVGGGNARGLGINLRFIPFRDNSGLDEGPPPPAPPKQIEAKPESGPANSGRMS